MITKIIAENEIQKAKKYTDYAERIVIVSHISPDGDAVGSSLGLYHFLLELGKQANIIVPNEFPNFLKWIKGAKDILIYEKNPTMAAELIADAELIFCLDFNALKRIGDMATLVGDASGKKVMIDHHLDPDKFCNVTMSYPQISSTSELVFRFICRMGYFELMNHAAAESIYVGMMTDTGAFTYNSNSPEIYAIIGELLRKGIDKDAIYARVYNTQSFNRIQLTGYVMSEKIKIYPEYHTALLVLSKEEAMRFNMKKGDTEGLVNIPLGIEGIVFSVFIREDEDLVKISLRSTGNFPANKFASENFNGGGHLNASGGEFYGELEDAVAVFEKALPMYFK